MVTTANLSPAGTVLHRATALHHLGRLSEADAILRALLKAQPAHFDALHLLGFICLQQGKADEAIRLLRKAVVRNPAAADAPMAYLNLGVAQKKAGRPQDALASYQKAIALKPDYGDAHYHIGNALLALERYQEAVPSYRKGLALKPGFVDGHLNLGRALFEIQDYEQALSHYETAAALNPDFAEAHRNVGVTLLEIRRLPEAVVCFERALALQPDYADAHHELANTLMGMGRYDEALSHYDQAILLKPDDVDAHWAKSLGLLLLGRFREGWAEYEWRWRGPLKIYRRPYPQPQWDGDADLTGKTILLHDEQGLGDTLQFVRYAPLLARRGAKIILEVPQQLMRVLDGLEGVIALCQSGTAPPPFDFWCSLMSLPLAFGTTLETIPAGPPYLLAQPQQVSLWRQRIDALPGLRVGLVWAGAPRPFNRNASATDRRRSLTLAQFAPLAEIEGVSFVSLQKGEPASQMVAPPFGMTIHDWTAELDDFADTAALIEALDLVISVDTAVVHLAGALGKPVWLLNRFDTCWRWLLHRDDSPWYPSLRQFRQPEPGDWNTVFRAVGAALAKLVAGNGDESGRAFPHHDETNRERAGQEVAIDGFSQRLSGES